MLEPARRLPTIRLWMIMLLVLISALGCALVGALGSIGMVVFVLLFFPVFGPLIGARLGKWRMTPPFPPAIAGAVIGAVVQAILAGIICDLIARYGDHPVKPRRGMGMAMGQLTFMVGGTLAIALSLGLLIAHARQRRPQADHPLPTPPDGLPR